MNRYNINVFYSNEDQCWLADVPDLTYCTAHGDTPHEAVAEVEKALELWLDVAREDGRPIPEPHYRPPVAWLA